MQNQKSAIGLDGNLTALIGYIVGIVALVEIFIEKENRFAKFHAIQSILFHFGAWILLTVLWVLAIFLWIGGAALGAAIGSAVSVIVGLIAWLVALICLLVFLGYLGGLIFAAIKSYQGNMFKLPIVGKLAEKWS